MSTRTSHTYVTDDMRRTFREDGVVLLKGVLEETWMKLVQLGIRRNRQTPGPYAQRHYPDTPREFYDDYCNYFAILEYQMLLERSPIVDVVADVMESEHLWLFYEQIFLKRPPEEGGVARRTPWHQDSTYWITDPNGRQQCAFWITLDDTPIEESLEYVRGSHLGPTYAGTSFDPNDETVAFQPGYQPIPDIEADRDSFDIVSFGIERGDVLMFHPNMLHGGGAGTTGKGRRTLSIRFFGDDVVYEPREKPEPPYPGHEAVNTPGEPLRGHWHPQLR